MIVSKFVKKNSIFFPKINKSKQIYFRFKCQNKKFELNIDLNFQWSLIKICYI